MFNYAKPVRYEDGKPVYYKEGSCDSSDTKPTKANTPVGSFFDVAEGSILVESNTGKVFFFNEKSDTWVEQFSFQG